MTVSLKNDWRNFSRSWIHHTGLQLATLTVLAATYAVIAFVFTFSLNINRLLTSIGENHQLTAYLEENLAESQVQRIQEAIASLSDINLVSYISREKATESFKGLMASYAPDFLDDLGSNHPFPASIQVSFKGGIKSAEDVKRVELVAGQVETIEGVEDVSFGRGWLENYSSFVMAITTGAGVVCLILLAASLFTIGNAIRTSISARREEIEILELVGATHWMIRRPYITEGMAMGLISVVVALAVNFGLYNWQLSVMEASPSFTRLTTHFLFPGPLLCLGLAFVGATLGGAAAWGSTRQLNSGWSASRRLGAL